MAKGKEIKRPKEETSAICLAYINAFMSGISAEKSAVIAVFE